MLCDYTLKKSASQHVILRFAGKNYYLKNRWTYKLVKRPHLGNAPLWGGGHRLKSLPPPYWGHMPGAQRGTLKSYNSVSTSQRGSQSYMHF